MKRRLELAAWWLLPALYCLALAACTSAPARKPVTGAAWQPFLVEGMVLAKSFQPAHAEPAAIAGQVVVQQIPATWTFVVVTHYGALTFRTSPGLYAAFLEREHVLVRGAVSPDGKALRVDAMARAGATRPRGLGSSV